VDEDGAQHVSVDGVAGQVGAADREDLVAFARRMAGDGLAPGTSGNLSVRRQDTVAITPSGVSYERMGPADICLVRVAAGGGRAAAEPLPGAGRKEPLPGAGREEPVLGLRTTRFEAFRWRMGRRSRDQLAALDWSGDPAPVLDHLVVFGPARTDIIE